VLVAASAWVIGVAPLSDNSFFTHLATGRVILDTGSIPTSDPYTFTAPGEPWVVQSWLASWLYATVESIAGGAGLRALMGVATAGLALLGWMLTASCPSVVPRLALVVVFLSASAPTWSERPLLFGFLGLALSVLAGEGRLRAPWLLPIGWIWAQTHGSYPLGLLYLTVVWLMARIDGADSATAGRALKWLALGIVAAVIGPLGLEVLLFPFALLQRQEALSHVTEWRPPSFDDLAQRVFLLQVLTSVMLIARRPSYRFAAVVVVFGGAALLGRRNLPVASMVLLPWMAGATPPVGSLGPDLIQRRVVGPVVLAAAAMVAVGAVRLTSPSFDLARYPVSELAAVEQRGTDLDIQRLGAPDVVGNLRTVLYGPRGDIFADDRFDMFPAAVLDDQITLTEGGPGVLAVLDRHSIELVIWRRIGGTAPQLIADPGWAVLVTTDDWLLACRRVRGAAAGGAC
jgi:hypothetical protein